MEKELLKGYKVTIGIEVHAELATNTKAYCGCKQEFKAEPNTHICPTCMGLPGSLPSFNEKVLEYAIKAGLAVGCSIRKETKFDRKNYFYPDLVKGYQISQFDKPICEDGKLEIEVIGKEAVYKKEIGIERIHMEEDTAKLTQDPFGRGTLIDFNRGGIPLIEIVSKPDMNSIEEAIAYLETLRKLLVYLGVAECKMEEGGYRADVNISVSKTDKLGNRAEIKNMNSFKSIERALQYEILRQIDLLESGEKIEQSTLRWDDVEGKTHVMRSKETAKDYRYFPEADLPIIMVQDEMIDRIKKEMPELLNEKKERYQKEFDLSDKQLTFILSDKVYIDLFEKLNENLNMPKEIANILMTDVAAYVNQNVLKPEELDISLENFIKFFELIKKNVLNSKTAKVVIEEMLKTNKNPQKIIEEKGLVQITDSSEIEKIVDKVLANNAKSIEDYRNGKDKALAFLVGQCMKESKGKANPSMVNEMILKKI